MLFPRGIRNCERQHLVLPARERADQESGDVRIESRTRRRLDERAQFAVVVRSAEPTPVLNYVDVGALPDQRLFADGG